MSLVAPLVKSLVSPLVVSLLGGGAISAEAALDAALEAEATSGDFVAQPDLTDLTSIFQADGSGNPSIGDSIDGATVLDTSHFGGKTAAEFIAGQAELAGGVTGESFSGSAPTESSGSWILYRSSDSSTNQYLSLSISEAGTYIVSFDVADDATAAGDGVQVRDGGTIVGGSFNSQSATYVGSFSQSEIRIQPTGPGHSAVVSNISIKHLPGNHTTASGTGPTVAGANTTERGPELFSAFDFLGTGWTYSDGTLVATGVSSGQSSYDAIIDNGETFDVQFDVSRASGTLQVYIDGTLVESFTADGSGSYVITGAGGNQRLQFTSSSFEGSVTNISVKKVIQNPIVSLNGTDDKLTLPLPSSGPDLTSMSITMAVRTSDEDGVLVEGQSASYRLGIFVNGSAGSKNLGVGTPTYRLDGADWSPANTNQIHDAISADTGWHVITASAAEFSSLTELIFGNGTVYDLAHISIYPDNTATRDLAEAAAADAIKATGYALAA